MPKAKRAAIYCRISKDKAGTLAGVQRQERDCREHVEGHGWDLVNVFTDDDTSAFAGKPRPAYNELLDLISAGGVDVLVAWHPDRITRNPRELEDLIETLDESHCQVETVRAGRVDLSTRSGRTTARLIGAVARDESEAKAERLQAMHADRARRGLFSGGPRPYGYAQNPDGGMSIIEPEAQVIREVADRVISGEWVGAIAHDLNERGIETLRGGKWRAQTLRRLVTSHTVAGQREHKGGVVEAAWPAILDSATWRQTNARIKDPTRARGTVARVALLAGIARCGDCEARLITQRRRSGRRVYVCPARTRGGCGGVQVVAEPLEEHVRDVLMAELREPKFLEHMTTDDGGRRDAINAELDRIAEDREELGRQWLKREERDTDLWLAAGRALDEEQARLEAELAALPVPVERVDPDVALQAWPRMTLAEQRSLIAMFIEAVVVHRAVARGPVFDPGRVDPEQDVVWRKV